MQAPQRYEGRNDQKDICRDQTWNDLVSATLNQLKKN